MVLRGGNGAFRGTGRGRMAAGVSARITDLRGGASSFHTEQPAKYYTDVTKLSSRPPSHADRGNASRNNAGAVQNVAAHGL
ncbi:hypothetical protein FRUB_07725 [Fimbriiglobus ruber]|uniref:Uncharacterized protein n=1 Tax=Fimbriiglobus ruber TaxID=1908690 RepID=A0A225DQG4_9BACT|nr:hypothetical protein FRUB_07725 [Fimbriiglobus ruber]